MLGLVLDGIVAGLLLLTLGLGLKLHLALRLLRNDNTDFESLIGAIDSATERARSALDGLKRTAGEEGERLAGDIDKAQRVQDDLRFLCERAERLADGVARQIEASRVPPRPVRAEAAAKPRPSVQPAADLERTLRALR